MIGPSPVAIVGPMVTMGAPRIAFTSASGVASVAAFTASVADAAALPQALASVENWVRDSIS